MKEIRSFIDVFQKLQYIMTTSQKRDGKVVLFLLVVGSFLELLGISAMLPLIYAILDIDRLKNNTKAALILDFFGIHSDMGVIVLVVSGVVVIYVVKNVCLMYIKYRQEKFACGYKKEVSVRMLNAFLYQPYEYFLNVNLADILSGVYGDVDGSYNAISTMLLIGTDIIGIIVIGAYLVYTDPFIAGGTFLVAIMCVIVLFETVRNKTKKMGYRQRELHAAAYKSVCQAINGVKEILVMKRQAEFLEDYEKAYDEKRKIEIIFNCMTAMPTKVIETFLISGLAIVIGIRSVVFDSNNVEFVTKMAIFAVGAIKLLPYISQISSGLTQLVYSRLNIYRTYNNLKSTEEFTKEKEDKDGETFRSVEYGEKIKFERELSIEDIHWHYKGVDEDILNGLSLSVKKGESIGIMGESGAGKSTLTDIILGLFHPQKGDVLSDGHSIYGDDTKSWSHIIGFVPQSIYLMDDTIRNNVLFGLPRPDTDEIIWKALEQAQLKRFVETLPHQLDTVVGDRGVKMSGGQRQRLAIARALYYSPQILVLDEATSALDNETEEALMESIEALRGEKTLIIVAHRLTTIKSCDHIYEVVGGKIVERDKREVFG